MEFETRKDALSREKKLKNLKSKRLINSYIEQNGNLVDGSLEFCKIGDFD